MIVRWLSPSSSMALTSRPTFCRGFPPSPRKSGGAADSSGRPSCGISRSRDSRHRAAHAPKRPNNSRKRGDPCFPSGTGWPLAPCDLRYCPPAGRGTSSRRGNATEQDNSPAGRDSRCAECQRRTPCETDRRARARGAICRNGQCDSRLRRDLAIVSYSVESRVALRHISTFRLGGP